MNKNPQNGLGKIIGLLMTLFFVLAQVQGQDKATNAVIEKAQTRMKGFQMPPGMQADLWADSTQIQNPSAICFDSKGRMYVAEIHRWGEGVSAITHQMYMVNEDIQLKSNKERLAMYMKHSDKRPMDWYTRKSDQIKVLEDTNGDGKADDVKVFATGFNNPLDGPGIGLIERDGKIYYSNVPHIWMLEDKDGDGVADTRKSIQDGFGLRLSYSGHDIHGLIWGPDGKLYWSVGDRGYNVVTKEGKKYMGQNEGGVFRCDPDGSNVELFYKRLRNPQELQFDDFGNLFTADNDGDGSDLERINYLVEGGDSGWTAGHQALMSFTRSLNFRSYKYLKKKPFNSWELEKMWKVRNDLQPQSILPGIGQINGGPSGFLFNPAGSLGEKYRRSFFVIHYKGSIARSYISTFNTEELGAGFKTINHQEFFKGSNCVDIEFGPDGKLYISEFNYNGWQKQDVGNIYSLYFPNEIAKPAIQQNKKVLLSDFSKLSVAKLGELLGWDHQTVRQKAQFELAKRGQDGFDEFKSALSNKKNSVLKRVHAIWGIGQMIRKNPSFANEVFSYLNDQEDQVRIQAARVLGDNRVQQAAPLLVKALEDKNPRAVMYAAIGLGRMNHDAVASVVDLLRKNADQDLFLRHGLVMALVGLDKTNGFIWYAGDKSASVRLAVLLALRKQGDAAVAMFLNDASDMVRDEAIRAINDKPIISATGQLAEELAKYSADKIFKIPKSDNEKYMHHRIINANFNNGTVNDAIRLLKYAANTKLDDRERLEALAAIEGWNDKNTLDNTTGLPRELGKRADIKTAVQAELGNVLKVANGKVQAIAIRVAVKFGYELKSEVLHKHLNDPKTAFEIRIEAINILLLKKDPKLRVSIGALVIDKNPQIRFKAYEALLTLDPESGVRQILKTYIHGTVLDKQNAWKLLSTQNGSETKKAFINELSDVFSGKGDKFVMLDVIEAAKASAIPEVKLQLAKYEEFFKSEKVMNKYKRVLFGGNANKGKDTFMNSPTAQCIRCHKVKGVGGDVGPDLSSIGKSKDRQYILESIVDPGAQVAKGFGLITLTLKDGNTVQGTLVEETDSETVVKLANGKLQKYKKAQIKNASKPVSSMPPLYHILSHFEIRDLVEYLSVLRL
jgi:quinoprotein glucose dehydrogenase